MTALTLSLIFMAALLAVLLLTGLFIRVWQGRPLSAGLTITAGAFALAAGLHDIGSLPPDLVLARHLLLYAFGLAFVLLDISNHWLPLEFTAPFMLCGLLMAGLQQPENVSHALVSVAMMAGLLSLFRQVMNRHYRQEVFGKGDIWMMAGLAAFFPFPVAASLLTAGLALMLPVSLIRQAPALPLAPFVMLPVMALCLLPPDFIWRLNL